MVLCLAKATVTLCQLRMHMQIHAIDCIRSKKGTRRSESPMNSMYSPRPVSSAASPLMQSEGGRPKSALHGKEELAKVDNGQGEIPAAAGALMYGF